MRSATEMLCKYQVTGNQELKKKSMHYYFVILVFAVGAAMGALFIRQIGDHAPVLLIEMAPVDPARFQRLDDMAGMLA